MQGYCFAGTGKAAYDYQSHVLYFLAGLICSVVVLGNSLMLTGD